ncbi:PDZ domain-containing protein [Arthrobacter tecti]
MNIPSREPELRLVRLTSDALLPQTGDGFAPIPKVTLLTQPLSQDTIQPDHGPRKRDPRFTVMWASGLLAAGLGVAAVALPAPYVIESPGPTFNTIGQIDSEPLISVDGRETYPTSGGLDLTTVFVSGSPGQPVSIFDAFRAWADPAQAVTPRELVYPPDVSESDIEERNAAAMTSSQESAVAAALSHLEVPYDETLSVVGLAQDSASEGILQEGDVLVAINGEPIGSLEPLKEALNAAGGESVEITVLREGQEVTEAVTPIESETGDYQLGVFLMSEFQFPFDVDIALNNVGGPSAGTMFALGIVDKLTEGELTGGEHFAGTGTIDSSGNVGPIGGIRQKLIGARDAGAEVFLAPAANCEEVVGHVPDGLRVVRVQTLDDAVDAVRTLGAENDDGGQLASCEG